MKVGIQGAKESLDSVRALVMDELPQVLERRSSVSYKADGSPVTAADVYLEDKILGHLAARFPGLRFVAEEAGPGAISARQGLLAILDPIDGTENFCSGLKEWGVSLGLWEDGFHLGSLLMAPELGESIISGEPVEYFASRITGFSSSFHPLIASGIQAASEYRVTGSATCNILNVIRGSFTAFVNPKGAYVWDLLPGASLALEHRCDVFINEERFDGRLLSNDQRYRIEIRHGHDRHPG